MRVWFKFLFIQDTVDWYASFNNAGITLNIFMGLDSTGRPQVRL